MKLSCHLHVDQLQLRSVPAFLVLINLEAVRRIVHAERNNTGCWGLAAVPSPYCWDSRPCLPEEASRFEPEKVTWELDNTEVPARGVKYSTVGLGRTGRPGESWIHRRGRPAGYIAAALVRTGWADRRLEGAHSPLLLDCTVLGERLFVDASSLAARRKLAANLGIGAERLGQRSYSRRKPGPVNIPS